jgi:transposase
MLRVEEVHVLRHKVLVEGRSRRQVARELGISRNTVRRYLTLAEPVRRERAPRPRPVFERVQPRLDELIAQWSERTTLKQRLTATRLHRQLREEGYAVGVTLVRDHLREWRRRQAEVYVPLVHHPGEEAQVDFFEVTVEVGGERRKAWKFLLRLMYSGRDFTWLYERCDQLASPAHRALRGAGQPLPVRAELRAPGRGSRQGRGGGARAGDPAAAPDADPAR